jgi:hypothetical protein
MGTTKSLLSAKIDNCCGRRFDDVDGAPLRGDLTPGEADNIEIQEFSNKICPIVGRVTMVVDDHNRYCLA